MAFYTATMSDLASLQQFYSQTNMSLLRDIFKSCKVKHDLQPVSLTKFHGMPFQDLLTYVSALLALNYYHAKGGQLGTGLRTLFTNLIVSRMTELEHLKPKYVFSSIFLDFLLILC